MPGICSGLVKCSGIGCCAADMESLLRKLDCLANGERHEAAGSLCKSCAGLGVSGFTACSLALDAGPQAEDLSPPSLDSKNLRYDYCNQLSHDPHGVCRARGPFAPQRKETRSNVRED